MAGIFSLINAARLGAGKSSLGWINPVLYRGHQYYTNDIVSGKNNCPASSFSSAQCCKQGFSAKVGWDPVTGLGSINFTPFMDLMLNLEDISGPVIVTSPPTQQLTRAPTSKPSQRTDAPTPVLTNTPTRSPTPQPTTDPTFEPSLQPSPSPTREPTTRPLGATFGSGRAPRAPIGLTSSLPTTFPTPKIRTKSKKISSGKGKSKVKKNTKGKGKGKR